MAGKATSSDHGILGGTPVFSGTRVPVRILIEHLEVGDRLDDFLDSYPTVIARASDRGAQDREDGPDREIG